VFTALLMFQMRDAGILSVDDPVAKWMPGFSVRQTYETARPITLRQLASHTAGLPRETPCYNPTVEHDCTEEQILEALSSMYVIMPQYTNAHYSNLGVSLLGRALGHAAEDTFENVIQTAVLNPLHMHLSSFNFTKTIQGLMAVGVDENQTPLPTTPDLPRWDSPCGGLYSNAEDMAQFMSFMFRTNRTEGGDEVVDFSTVNEFLRPVMELPDAYTQFGTPWEFAYDAQNQVWIKAKAGALPGYRSQVALVPALKLGVFASALRTTIDQWDPTMTVWTTPILDILIPALVKILQPLQPPPALLSNWELFVGNYTFGVSIYVDGQALSTNIAAPNLAQLIAFEASPAILRMQLLQTDTIACRWLDDGADQELLYFTISNNSTSFAFMGQIFNKQ